MAPKLTSLSFLIVALHAWSALAGPADPDQYVESVASQSEIPAGAIVEGSVKLGGIQPDYELDFHAKAFDPLKANMKQIRDSQDPFTKKVERVLDYVRRKALEDRAYDSPAYRNLLARYRKAGKNIPISEYVNVKAGVCREDALIMNLALKEAGIPSKFYYVKVKYRLRGFSRWVEEDHGFNVIEYQGEKWVVDSNTPRYNGFKLADLQKGLGLYSDVQTLPFAERWRQVDRTVTAVHSFPKMWVPKDCQAHYESIPR